MKNYSGVVIHLIKFIDAANTSIREYKSSTLKNDFFCFWVFCHIDCKTNGWASFTRSVNSSWCNFVDIGEKLRFSSRWITTKEDVDLSSLSTTTIFTKVFAASTEKLTKDSLFDVMIFPDTWRKSVNKKIIKLWRVSKLHKLSLLLQRYRLLVFLIKSLILNLSIYAITIFFSHLLSWFLLIHIIIIIIFISLFVGFDISNYINIRSINVFERSHLRINSLPLCTINTDNFNSVTRFHIIN